MSPTDTPIPGIIGDTLIILAIIAAVIWAGCRLYRGIVDRREPEPETHGDDGGHPTAEVCRRAAQKVTRERVRQMTPAPETGSGLRAEGRRTIAYEEWIASGARDEFMRASRSARADRPQDF